MEQLNLPAVARPIGYSVIPTHTHEKQKSVTEDQLFSVESFLSRVRTVEMEKAATEVNTRMFDSNFALA